MSSRDRNGLAAAAIISPIPHLIAPESSRRRPVTHSPEKSRDPPRSHGGIQRSRAHDRELGSSRDRLERPPPIADDKGHPGLPPTPPVHIVDQNTRAALNNGLKMGMTFYMDEDSGLSTPLDPRSPPTPEITPPRDHSRQHTLQPPSSLRSLRAASSRTASFKTAKEDQWSSDDESRTSSRDRTNGKTVSGKLPSRLQQLSLGSGTNANGDTTHSSSRPGDTDFRTFDGSWGHRFEEEKKRADREWVDNLKRNATTRKGNEEAPIITNGTITPEHAVSHEESIVTETSRDRSIRQRIQQNRADIDRDSTEKFAEQISWPSAANASYSDTVPTDSDTRRFSGMSCTSTIIEAMIFDETPRRKIRTLRHKGKNDALRALSITSMRSVSLPVPVTAPPRRLVHKKSQILDRQSLDLQPERTGRSKSRDEPIRPSHAAHTPPIINEPTLDIDPAFHEPTLDLGAAFAPAVADRHHTNGTPPRDRSLSNGNTPIKARHSTAMDNSPGYFDIPKRRKRTMSDSVSSALRYSGEGGRPFGPVIPPRSSSLSAPTSRNVSRTVSLTSASAHSGGSHRKADSFPYKTRGMESSPSARHQSPSRRDSTTLGQHLAAPHTPFSLNSTPEALQLSEATAMSIYPHNNNSLLVVEQQSRPTSYEYERHATMNDEPLTPPSFGRQLQEVDSPLKNPRPPPTPPAFQIIPPTPDVLTPSMEVDRRLEASPQRMQSTDRSWQGGAISLVKRALSNRRYSESFVSPFARRSRVEAAPVGRLDRKETRLSPFWLPRGFWDDLDVGDGDIEDEFLERGRSELLEAPRIGRRISYPMLNRDDPDGLHEFESRKTTSSRSASSSKGRKKRRVHSIPALGVQIEFIGFNGVSKRFRQVASARGERARERERSRMKGRISPPRPIENSVI